MRRLLSRKIGSTEWTVGKLLTLVLAVILLILVIWGWTSGAFTPLKNKLSSAWDSILALFGRQIANNNPFIFKVVDVEGVGRANLTITEGECKLDFENKLGSYRYNFINGHLEQFALIYYAGFAGTSGGVGPMGVGSAGSAASYTYVKFSNLIGQWVWSMDGSSWKLISEYGDAQKEYNKANNLEEMGRDVRLLAPPENYDQGVKLMNNRMIATKDLQNGDRIFSDTRWVDVDSEITLAPAVETIWTASLVDSLKAKKDNFMIDGVSAKLTQNGIMIDDPEYDKIYYYGKGTDGSGSYGVLYGDRGSDKIFVAPGSDPNVEVIKKSVVVALGQNRVGDYDLRFMSFVDMFNLYDFSFENYFAVDEASRHLYLNSFAYSESGVYNNLFATEKVANSVRATTDFSGTGQNGKRYWTGLKTTPSSFLGAVYHLTTGQTEPLFYVDTNGYSYGVDYSGVIYEKNSDGNFVAKNTNFVNVASSQTMRDNADKLKKIKDFLNRECK